MKLPPSKAQILEAWENGAEPWQSTYSERLEDEKDFYSVCVYDTNPPDDEWRWNGRLDFSLHADPDFIPPWCTVWTKEQEDDLLKKEVRVIYSPVDSLQFFFLKKISSENLEKPNYFWQD